LRFDIAKQKIMTYEFVQKIRDEIQAFFAGLSSGPMSTAVQTAIRQIKEVLKMIKKAADFVTDVAKAVADFIKYCNEILAYIASLPAKLAQLLAKCVQEFTDALFEALSFDDPSAPSGASTTFSEIKSLVSDATKTAESIQTAVSATTGAVAQAQALAYSASSFGKV
jgi:phage-related minor tail protein